MRLRTRYYGRKPLIYNGGDDSREDPPVPIPNTEVKLSYADGTASRGRVGSCRLSDEITDCLIAVRYCYIVRRIMKQNGDIYFCEDKKFSSVGWPAGRESGIHGFYEMKNIGCMGFITKHD